MPCVGSSEVQLAALLTISVLVAVHCSSWVISAMGMGSVHRRPWLLLIVLLSICCGAPQAHARGELRCNTLDPSGGPAAFFAPGDKVVVEGRGFPSLSVVSVGFQQGSIEQDLVTATSTDEGAFTTPPTIVPSRAAKGAATIVVTGGYSKATCGIEVLLVAKTTSGSPRLTAWTVLLAAFGLALLAFGWRTRRVTQLGEAVSAAPVRIELRAPVTREVPAEITQEVPLLDTSAWNTPVPSKSQTVSRLLEEARSWSDR